jgi:hypothetical protein
MIAALIESIIEGLLFIVGLRLALCILFLVLAVFSYLSGAFTAAAICLVLSLVFGTWLYLKPPSSIIED